MRVWFPEDPMHHWLTKAEGHATGWENWLRGAITIPKVVTGVIAIPAAPKETIIVPVALPVNTVPGLAYTEVPF